MPDADESATAATHTRADVAAALQDSLPGAVQQVLDQIDVELRSMTDTERRDATDRADLTRLPGWVVDRLAHEAEAQQLARQTTTPDQRAQWQSRAERLDHALAHILGLPEPGTGWTDRISSDPLHHLRALTRRPDAPAELRHLVDTATLCLNLQDIAAAVEPLHRALADWPIAEHTDQAAAIAWELALQARADGGGTPDISAAIHGQSGQRWIEIHVSDNSRTLPARESGSRLGWRAVDLLDTHTETWGWELPATAENKSGSSFSKRPTPTTPRKHHRNSSSTCRYRRTPCNMARASRGEQYDSACDRPATRIPTR